MKSFLTAVSADLMNKFGNDLSHVAVVFPNKRAELFMNESIAELTTKPVWSPTYTTISSLMRQMSPLRVADPIELICRLYPIYCKIKGIGEDEESLDQFYSWGEIMISDFDDIDKNLVEADKLFRNIKELGEIEFDYLEEERETIETFFSKLNKSRTTLQTRFVSTWNVMLPIYEEYMKALKEQEIGYEGMVYRDAIKNFNPEKLEYEKYVFVGFNVLSKVEKELFRKIKDCGKAMFYWDYDNYYTTDNTQHEAGVFIRENLKEFGCEFTPDNALYNNFRNKKITIVKAATENVQARMLNQWISKNKSEKENETAVVLCDESLLAPVMHSIPDNVHDMNITMGYPLKGTPISSMITALLDLQHSLEGKDAVENPEFLVKVLRHPYAVLLTEKSQELLNFMVKNQGIHKLSELKEKISNIDFLLKPISCNEELIDWLIDSVSIIAHNMNPSEEDKESDNDEAEKEERTDYMRQLSNESLFKTFTTLNRLKGLIESGLLSINQYTLNKLIYQLISTQSIPFHGEPAIGLQILGVLETRNIDFRNIAMLSVNEGKLPKGNSNVSFIPYIMRQPFGLTTIERKISVYAYYFYRLLQRAENITLVYNSTVTTNDKGEQSRFLLQLMSEFDGTIEHQTLVSEQNTTSSEEKTDITKTREHVEGLKRRYERGYLSPSALNTYLNCSRKFYYRYIKNIKEPEEISFEFDNRVFGLVFHKAAELIYTDFGKDVISKEKLQNLADSKSQPILEQYVKRAINDELYRLQMEDAKKMEFNGMQNLSIEAVVYFLRRLLKIDSQLDQLRVYELESDHFYDFNVKTEDGNFKLKVGGRIDRMDVVEDNGKTLRIVDYKTGSENNDIAAINELFNKENGRDGYALQACLYASIMSKKEPNMKVTPLLVHINKPKDNHEAVLTINKDPISDFSKYVAEFDEALKAKLSEIFDTRKPFTRATDEKTCSYCPYKLICEKNK